MQNQLKNSSILFCFLISLSVMFGQSKSSGVTDQKVLFKLKQADELMSQKSYYNAIDIYIECLAKAQSNVYVNHQLATAYYKSRDYVNAIRYYQNAVGYDNPTAPRYPFDVFYLGESLKARGQYEEAKIQYIKFYKQKVRTVEFKEYTNFAKQALKGCDYALEKNSRDDIHFKLEHLENDINHAYSDFSPTVFGDKLYFSSLRNDSVLTYSYGSRSYFPHKNL
jgi:tetratricopeptide (TPR) repeat protein